MPIEIPSSDERRSALRAIVESIASFEPITGALTRIYTYTHPSQFERDIETWRKNITIAANFHETAIEELESILRPKLRIGEVAAQISTYLVRATTNGFYDMHGWNEIKAAFPNANEIEIHDALAELKHCGLIHVHSAIGAPVAAIHTTYDLFWAFDGAVMGYDTRADAVYLAESLLEDDCNAVIPRLHEKTGWNRRRFNPPLAYLLQFFAPGRISNELQNQYPTTNVIITADERYHLKAFAQQHRKPDV
ncbi:hypothetical protein [Skermanella stibiiresistens]|uniref:hypothetical protein n=1 Tax=Skermanella stibiiresistens TaxID=913326 RepID=UPI0012FCFFE4|nr:hypothetical protein [Skermanella stibiiresistens]